VYATLLGLIAATGLRVSEALHLRLADVLPDGILHIRHAKFGKSRYVPLHPTVVDGLHRYLEARRRVAGVDDHVFVSASHRRISASMVNYTFRRVLALADIASPAGRLPRIHDLRHTFATRSLERAVPPGAKTSGSISWPSRPIWAMATSRIPTGTSKRRPS
jgi:integrase